MPIGPLMGQSVRVSIKLPTNVYESTVTERDALLAIQEELRIIRRVAVLLAVFAVPLMLLGIVDLLSS